MILHRLRNRFHPLWRIRRFKLFRALQAKLDPDVRIQIEGTMVYVKLLRDAALVFDRSDMEEGSREAFRAAVREYNVELFFDIGANIGLYSWTALACGVSEIFLVEADPTNQRLLAKTIRRSTLVRCYLVPFAMSDSVGTSRFLLDAASGATGGLEGGATELHPLRQRYGMTHFQTVPTLALDVFTTYARGKSTILKIDVEGAEHLVFKGAESFIDTVRPVISVECFDRARLGCFDQKGYSVVELPETYNYLLVPKEGR